jgi:hypothetical protein
MFYDIYLYTLCYYICCLLWRMYEMHLALFLKAGCDRKQCIKGFQAIPMNLMHISLDLSVRKVFKNTRKGVACTGACLE